MSPRASTDRARRPLWALVLLTLGGCASAGKAPGSPAALPPPSSPAEARRELVELEASIHHNRLALGLPARAEADQAQGVASPGPSEASQAEPPAAPAAESPPPAPVAAEKVSRAEATSADEEADCSPGCRYTRAICHAAERICTLARYLGEEDAHRRCRRAQQDCRDARQATRDASCDDCG